MRSIRLFSKLLLILSLGGGYQACAEDVDIFLENDDNTTTRPNVLLVLDNASSNNSSITMLDGVSSGDKLEMLRQVLNNIIDPMNSTYFPTCAVTTVAGVEVRTPTDCVTRQEVNDLLDNINLGLMIGNPSGSDKGGYVRYHVRPMDQVANRTSLIVKINPGIPQANNAPYAKMMHESYLYYGGKLAYVGFDSNLYDTAAKQAGSDYYVSPATDSCQDNYIIFVGNGGPDAGEQNDTGTLLSGIGGKLTTDPVQFTPDNLVSSWFDEYARTLKKQDVVPGLAGIQNVTSYTIAVQNPAANNYNTNTMASARQLLKSGAALGGGEYFEANNGQAVMKAFVDLLRKFQAVDSVFAASTLPVSVNVRGTYLNQVYMGQFRPDGDAGPRWPGNLKQYQIALNASGQPILADRNGSGVEDTVNGFILANKTSFWTTNSSYWAFDPLGNPPSANDAPDGNIVEKGGVAQRLRTTYATSQAARNLYTCNGSCAANQVLSTNEFKDSNTTGVTVGNLGVADEAERTALINWVRGADNKDNEDQNGVSTDIRARIHGDLLHSRPAVVNYNRDGNDSDIVVYYGANDGVFHAIKGGQADSDGYEKWGMVFPEFLGTLKRLRDNYPYISSTHRKPYFADGSVSVYQNDADGDGIVDVADDKVYLYVGMRRGGRFAYALNVSDPDNPKHLWKIDSGMDGFGELGQTWSTLRPAKIRAVASDPVVILGAGYDAENEDVEPATTNNKGRGIFVVNGRTGALVKHILPAGMGSVPGDPAVIDRNSDGYFDRIYVADTKANLWRVDIDDADPDNWSSYKIATLGGSGVDARKFLNKPDVVFGTGYDAVLIGSGDREHPFEATVTNRFYMLKDTRTGLSGAYLCVDDAGEGRPCVESDLTDVTGVSQIAADSVTKGWRLTLATGEKVVGNAITAYGTTFFGTNRPIPDDPDDGECSSNLGEAKLYAVWFNTGTATHDIDGDGDTDANDISEVIEGGGFPPSPIVARVLVTTTDGDGNSETKPVDVVCTGAHCVSPPNIETKPDRYRTFWYIEK